jgi:zinc/manganese transport system substrate-binding protein
MIFSRKIILLILLALPLPSQAALRVIVSLADFIEVAESIGGDLVSVDSLLDGSEDPHFVDAVPAFVSKVAKADVLCAVGLELELGWLPKVLSKSGNAKVQSGGKGFCELSKNVSVLEAQHGPLDRSMGHVHAAGNPHFYLSPSAMIQASKEILNILKVHLPEHTSKLEQNAKNFETQMVLLQKKVQALLSPLLNKQIAQYHKEFSYFFNEYNLKSDLTLEEKPGVPPSAARLVNISKESKAKNVLFAVGASYTPKQFLEKFTELSSITSLRLPSGVEKKGRASSIEKLQLLLAEEFLKASKVSPIK